MAELPPDPREIALEGSLNFRDLGGIETRSGARIRPRLLFRSDALHQITDRDLDMLAEFGIATLIDLRGQDEIDRSGPSPLLARGSRVAHASLVDATAEPIAPDTTIGLDVDYARMLDGVRPGFVQVFSTLAEESTLPAVIHCASGKDRTGITVALLLRLLDVPDETIVLDYAITDRNMARLLARRTPAENALFPDHYHRAAPETMVKFLASLDATYGSVVDYLLDAGLSPAQITTIRRRLLDSDSR